MRMRKSLIAGLTLVGLSAWPVAAAEKASAILKGVEGEDHGRAELTEVASGGVLFRVELKNIPPGPHAFHVHENGTCEPTFEAAGGHFNPDGRPHGVKAKGGPHAGDLGNLHVPESRRITAEVHAPGVTLAAGKPNSLLGGNGTTLVLHAKADDHSSQPAGDAGGRIACGVITSE
jgi:superoxide dismutase, Cu-Zn family